MAETGGNGRVVLITGASSGIGAATARRVAGPDTALLLHARGGRDGAKVGLLEDVAAACRARGAVAETILLDLDTSSPAALVGETVARFGRLDQIVANAGFAQKGSFESLERADLDRSLAMMTGGFFDLCRAARGQLEASAWGRVVAVSSFVAHVIPGGQEGGYVFPGTAAAKAAIEALARALAVELAPSGTTVNCVAPGFTRKEAAGHSAMGQGAWEKAAALTPSGRIAEPDDIAGVIAFLLGRDAAHMTGQVLHVDGGLTLV
ncbi:MAG: SDR family oxidoreductase [Azospirillaceae bacterium]